MEILNIVLIIITIVGGLLIFVAFNFARFLILPIRVRHSWVINNEEKKGLLSISWYNELVKEPIKINSQYGYDLYGELVLNSVPSDKIVIIVHGYRFNFIGSLKYGKMFLDMGYNVLWYDNCNSGNSKGRLVTMGKREHKDLAKVISYVRERYIDYKIGIHGESMGASLSIMYGASVSDLSFIIEDCGYSDLKEELTHQLRMLRMPVRLILPISRFFIYIMSGLKLSEVSPISLLRTNNALENIPMLFIHGDSDNFTPTNMCYEMYEAKKGKKYIYISHGAKHAESFMVDKVKYIATVKEFLKNTEFEENNNE